MDNDGLLIFELTLLYSDNNCYLSLLPIPIYRNIIDEVLRKKFICDMFPFLSTMTYYKLYYDDINKQYIAKNIIFDKYSLKRTLQNKHISID